jgi:hypothetical protein
MSGREKFTTQLACGCTEELKQQVEALAAYKEHSMADCVRDAVKHWVRARRQEPADVA